MDHSESGVTPKPLFPKAWAYYDGVMATCGFLLILLNVLALAQYSWAAWLNVVIAGVAAGAIWLRRRALQLGVIKASDAAHLQVQADNQRLTEDNQRLDAALDRVSEDNDKLRRAIVAVLDSTAAQRRRALDAARQIVGEVAEHEISEHSIPGSDSRPPDAPGRHSAEGDVG